MEPASRGLLAESNVILSDCKRSKISPWLAYKVTHRDIILTLLGYVKLLKASYLIGLEIGNVCHTDCFFKNGQTIQPSPRSPFQALTGNGQTRQ